jgi:hypothetical protein
LYPFRLAFNPCTSGLVLLIVVESSTLIRKLYTTANIRKMNETGLLLKAYYEALYEQLEAERDRLTTLIERLLTQEVAKRRFEGFDDQKYEAYIETCLAFVEERIEAYNPIGFQYTFDRVSAGKVAELELQLNWYDSRAEFKILVETAQAKTETAFAEESLGQLSRELIKQVGAFPDSSIITAYEVEPALIKLPDYVVARAIEEIVR